MDSRKIVYRETGIVALGVAVCVAVMLGVYAMLHMLDSTVLLGGVLGGILAIANFFFMAVGTSLAADKAEAQDVKGGKALLQMSMLIRYAVLFVLLFACAKSGLCAPIPLVLPLVFVRPVLSFGEFFRRKGDS